MRSLHGSKVTKNNPKNRLLLILNKVKMAIFSSFLHQTVTLIFLLPYLPISFFYTIVLHTPKAKIGKLVSPSFSRHARGEGLFRAAAQAPELPFLSPPRVCFSPPRVCFSPPRVCFPLPECAFPERGVCRQAGGAGQARPGAQSEVSWEYSGMSARPMACMSAAVR